MEYIFFFLAFLFQYGTITINYSKINVINELGQK